MARLIEDYPEGVRRTVIDAGVKFGADVPDTEKAAVSRARRISVEAAGEAFRQASRLRIWHMVVGFILLVVTLTRIDFVTDEASEGITSSIGGLALLAGVVAVFWIRRSNRISTGWLSHGSLRSDIEATLLAVWYQARQDAAEAGVAAPRPVLLPHPSSSALESPPVLQGPHYGPRPQALPYGVDETGA